MMLKCFAMPTTALGKGDRAQLPLPSPCWLSVALATIHSLPPPPPSRSRELRPATVATVTGTPLSVWLAGSSAHPQGDEGRGPVALATPESLQRRPLGFWRGWGRAGGWGRQQRGQTPWTAACQAPLSMGFSR